MPGIGVLCGRDEERKAIVQMIEMLSARDGFECSVCNISQKETVKWENITCVIVAWEDRERAFRCAEKLWDREQSVFVIYVAYRAEDINAALGMPFFHIVRLFRLEQDLETAFRKMERMRLPAADRIRFSQNGQLMLIPLKEILYLESQGHEVRLHLEKKRHLEKGMHLRKDMHLERGIHLEKDLPLKRGMSLERDMSLEKKPLMGESISPEKDIIVVRESLSQCEERLKGRGFVRIYTSFLVNMYHIRCLEKENVLLDNGEHLYVSRRKYPEVKLMFENYIRHLDFMR